MRIATAVAFLVLLATLASPSTSVVPSVEAASNCEGGSAPEWNTTLQRLALVPHASYGGPFYYDEVYYEDEDDRKEPVPAVKGMNGTLLCTPKRLTCTIRCGRFPPLTR